MRHGNRKYKIGRDSAHRRSLLRNLTSQILVHGQIKTTHTKCLAVRPYVEKLITMAKEDSLANRRLAHSRIGDKDAVHRLFTEIAPKFKTRPGGYTRIVKLPDGRVGDGASVSSISLVD